LNDERQVLDFVGQVLNQVGIGNSYLDDFGAYAAVDEFGHQISFKPFRAPPLSDDTGPELLLNVGLVLLVNASVESPEQWKKLALANSQAPFVRFSVNDRAQIMIDMDLFAVDLTPAILIRAFQALSLTARQHGDPMAEFFGGQRSFWKGGRGGP
jgi:type III secretion system-like peptide-binding chaperone